MRMPRFTIRALMVAVIVVGVALAATRRPYPISEGSYIHGPRSKGGAVVWSDGSITRYQVEIGDSLDVGPYHEPRVLVWSTPDPNPEHVHTHLGDWVTSLEWSDGSHDWYFTPFRNAL